MENLALGLIETVGFIAAVEAADIAAKTAEIRIVGLERVGRGLVTVLLTGDLSPVQAAVESGQQAASRLGTVHSSTVIARQGDGLSTLIKKHNPPKHSVKSQPCVSHSLPAEGLEDISQLTNSQLQRKRVAELKMFLHSLPDVSWTKAEIDAATKKELLLMIKKVVNEHQPQ